MNTNFLNRLFEHETFPKKKIGTAPNSDQRPTLARLGVILAALICLLLLPGRQAQASPVLIATIPVGTGPAGVGVNPTTNMIYVANFSSNTVSVIDGTINTVTATIPVGTGPIGVGVNPNTNLIYVGHSPSTYRMVTVIDGATNTVLTTIPTGIAQELNSVAANPITNEIYVTSRDPGGRVLKIDGATNTILNFISVAANPHSVSVNPITNKIYVGHGSFFGRDRITIIDGASNAVSDGPVVGLSQHIAVNPTTNRIYVYKGPPGAIEVKVIDGAANTVVATIPVGLGQGGVRVDPTSNRIYVARSANNDLIVIDGPTDTVVATIPVGTAPGGLGVNPVTGRVYVANNGSNTVSVIEDTIEATPPLITPNVSGSLGDNGWYVSDVSVSWTVSDPESGIASSLGCDPTTLTGDTPGTSLTCSATNGAGLSNSASVTVKLDKTPPDITIASPADGTEFLLNAVVASNYGCTDATSGLASCSGPVPSGGDVDTASVGAVLFTVNAMDNAGHPASLVHTYNVIYNFSGFFPPVDNLPMLNKVKAGSSVPIKFSLSGDQGLNVFEADYPKSQAITCDTSAPLSDIDETVTAGSSGLAYDASADQYVYVWKTDNSWAGTCRQLIVQLNDGTIHPANFKFK
jgi:YVTN family beta-propeller protein